MYEVNFMCGWTPIQLFVKDGNIKDVMEDVMNPKKDVVLVKCERDNKIYWIKKSLFDYVTVEVLEKLEDFDFNS